jgi:hypothetical protein
MLKTIISNLTCEYQINPLGIDVLQPRLSWQMQSDRRGAYQKSYQINECDHASQHGGSGQSSGAID